MGRVVGFLALLAVLVYTLVDCVQTQDARVRNLPKAAWVAIILFVPVVGWISWYAAGRPLGPQDRPPRRPPLPRGPDDDPDFLRGL